MPIYVYECERCGEFEHLQSMSSPVLEACPSCSGAVVRKIGGKTSIVMKGNAARNECSREVPCCGRETRCNVPPCGK